MQINIHNSTNIQNRQGFKKTRSVRNAAMIVIVLAICCCVILTLALKTVGVQLPLWADGSMALHLSGSSKHYAMPQTVQETIQDFSSGELQLAIEESINNNTPLRAQALIANASFQRSAIQASNVLFQWPIYPSYYGSSTFYFEKYNALIPSHPYTKDNWESGWNRFAEQLAEYARNHPDITFVTYFASESLDPDVNPLTHLNSSTASLEDLGNILNNRLSSIKNVMYLIQDYGSPEDFYSEYYSNDNHWNIIGAVSAYNEIARSMGLKSLEIEGFNEFETAYMGTWSRFGLYPIENKAFDISNDFSNLTIEKNGTAHSGDDHTYYENSSTFNKYLNFIMCYYDLFAEGINELTINDQENSNPQPAIMICDSFGYHIGRLLAQGFGHLDIYFWLYGANQGNQSISEILESTGNKIIVMVGTPEDYSTLLDRYPNLFKG